MAVISGEAIRMMNYVDDISATLRRITAGTALMSEEEKKRVAEYMRKSQPSITSVLEQLDKARG